MLNSYEFIDDFLNNEKIYSKKLKERVKVNGIFNEINISANNTLKKFIDTVQGIQDALQPYPEKIYRYESYKI